MFPLTHLPIYIYMCCSCYSSHVQPNLPATFSSGWTVFHHLPWNSHEIDPLIVGKKCCMPWCWSVQSREQSLLQPKIWSLEKYMLPAHLLHQSCSVIFPERSREWSSPFSRDKKEKWVVFPAMVVWSVGVPSWSWGWHWPSREFCRIRHLCHWGFQSRIRQADSSFIQVRTAWKEYWNLPIQIWHQSGRLQLRSCSQKCSSLLDPKNEVGIGISALFLQKFEFSPAK